MESMTQNTLTDLRSMEQQAEDGKDRYFLGLCTLFVATIEDAKDRISQLELVFCSQLFPAFQARLLESCQAAQAAESLHHHALQEWESSREALLRELHELRSERDSHLQGHEMLRRNLSGEIHELRQELLGFRKEKELRAEEESQRKVQLQEQEMLRRQLSGEIEALQQELVGFRQEKELRAEGESQRKLHLQDEETPRRELSIEERLLRQKDSMPGNFEKLSEETTELLRSNGKLRQEILDLRQHCLKLSSELGLLRSKMHSSSSETPPKVAETEGADAQGLQFKLEQKSQERSLECFRRQLLSAEVEKEKKATHAALVKLHDLKKRYRSLRKQYTVLFRQSHPLGHHKQAESVAICENQVASGHGDARVERYLSTNVRKAKGECSCRKAGKCIATPSSSNLSRKMEDGSKSAPSLDHRYVSGKFLSVSAMNDKNQERQVVEEEDLTKMMQACSEVNVVANCNPPTSADSFQSGKGVDKVFFAEEDKADDEDMILNTPQDLANSEKSAFGKNFSLLKKVLPGKSSQQEPDCTSVIHLDKASQIGFCNSSLLKVAEFDRGPSCDVLAEGTESCNSGENSQDSRRPAKAFTLLREVQGLNIEVSGAHRPADNDWFPVQKRTFPSKSHPKAVKSLKTTWRNTRSRAEVNGFDPHDDFLDTPHENVLKIHADQAVNNHHDMNALHENGILTNSFQDRGGLKPTKSRQEQPVNCGGGKDVSFSQITTQAPDAKAGFDEYANQNQEQPNEQACLQSSGSNHNMSRPNKHRNLEQKVQPLGGDNKNKHSSAMVSTKVSSASKQGPMYKYVEPVRKKDEREKLQGVECNQCKKFYDAVLTNNGSGVVSARCEHHNAVSRHRYRYIPPSTPEGFWNIGFDSDL